MHCPECGLVNTEGANYCQKCGAFLGDVTQAHENTTAAWQVDESGELKAVDPEQTAHGATLVIRAADHGFAFLTLAPQPVHELRAQNVDLAVQDAPLVRELLFLVGELLDEVFQLLVGE